MKTIKFISLSLLCLSLQSTVAQSTNEASRWSLGARINHLYDIGAYRFDTELSRDMRGLNGSFTQFDIGYSFYAERMFNPLFGLQLGYHGGSMTGANQVEYYENSFNEAQLNLILMLSNFSSSFAQSPWNVYGKFGLASGQFESTQYLQSDQVEDNSFADNYWKYQGGLGLQYELNRAWRLELDFSLNSVLNDGFDGYNSASGSDVYWATALGVAYSFGPKAQKAEFQKPIFSALACDGPPQTAAIVANDSLKWEEQAAQMAALQTELERTQAELESLKQAQAQPKPSSTKPETESLSVYFGFDQSYLSSTAKKALFEQLRDLRDIEGTRLVLTAYADATGPESYNVSLKQARANAVRDFILTLGFSADQIQIGLAKNQSPEELGNSFLNRRVDVEWE
tara:strand:- start:1035 stop:2228 length:1194 start_codon:yes stop_codon:yes gene_type:complete